MEKGVPRGDVPDFVDSKWEALPSLKSELARGWSVRSRRKGGRGNWHLLAEAAGLFSSSLDLK